MEDGIVSSRAVIHLFFSGFQEIQRLQAEVLPLLIPPQKLRNWPQNFPFQEENALKFPQTLSSPVPIPAGAIPAGLAASRGVWKTQKLQVQGKNSKFSSWERLRWQLCIPRLGARGWKTLWVMEGHIQEMSEKGKGTLPAPLEEGEHSQLWERSSK